MGCLKRKNLILFSADATFSLQTIPPVAEGGDFIVTVELATPGTLACAVVVTLVTATGSAVGKHNKHYM